MAKKRVVQVLTWDETGTILTIKYPFIGEEVVVDTGVFPIENQQHARKHGYHQRFGDLESGDKTGAAKVQAARQLAEHYADGGEWRMQGERDTLADLITAISRLMPKYSVEDLRKAAEEEPEQVEDWKDDPAVKVEIAKIRQERAEKAAKAAPKKKLVIRGLD